MEFGDEKLAVLRILDANRNRAVEGLRVVEDYLRFGLDDRHLAGHCKDLRHELVACLAGLPAEQLCAARDTGSDVGTRLETPAEYQRRDLPAVVAANLARVTQALRCLEEYSKLVAEDTARRLEQLRYATYTLERAVQLLRRSGARLQAARLYVLVDGCRSRDEFLQRVTAVVAGGADLVQLRDKSLGDRQLLERARAARVVTRDHGALLVINDRADIAVAAQADGLHLGQEELSVRDARVVVGPDRLIGVSTHSLDQARSAVLDGADYLGCGPVFPSPTKAFAAFPGLELLRQVAGEIRLPAFAIGGVTLDNLPQVLETGIRRVAVQGAVWPADDPRARVQALADQLESVPAARGE